MPLSALLGLLAQSSTPLALARDVVVNEFAAINDTILLDSDGEASDWIELHNVSDLVVSLTGWGLSDDAALPFKWVFPARTLPPGCWRSPSKFPTPPPPRRGRTASSDGKRSVEPR